MPTYTFESEDGRRVEEFFHGSEAPDFGSVLVRDGIEYRRIVDIPMGFARDFSHIAHQLPKWHPDAPHHIQSGKDAGKCAFETQRQVDEFVAKNPRFSYNKDV